MTSIARIISSSAKLTQTEYTALYWGFSFVVNIPLLIFSWFKIGKRFTALTAIHLATALVLGNVISLIPDLDTVAIFGKISDSQGSPDAPMLLNWTSPNNRPLILLVYAIAFAIINGWVYSVVYICGACTAGVDFFSFYYAKKKKKNISLILLVNNLVTLLIGTTIGSYIGANVNPNSQYHTGWSVDSLFSPNLIFSIVAVFVAILVVNYIYPKDKLVTIKIYTEKLDHVTKSIIDSSYRHSFTIYSGQGGYTKLQRSVIETTCRVPEAIKFIKTCTSADQDIFMTYTTTKGILGLFSINKDNE